MPFYDTIFLVGFMGSGKTTIGRKLAELLKSRFIDLDELIEQQSEIDIAGYFKKYGEDAFRTFEKKVLQTEIYHEVIQKDCLKVCKDSNSRRNTSEQIVVATGGGTACYFDNMDWMNLQGITVYLSLPVSTLVDRLKNDVINRPLIKGMNQKTLTEFVTQKLADREAFYKKAQIVISGRNLTVEQLLHKLKKFI